MEREIRMKHNKLVSVVIPTYSRPLYLERAIYSVLNQTYNNIEIIVVDDNNPSTEERRRTEQVMKKFVDNDRILYLLHDRNKNGSAARNTGWRASKGEYITFLDDDDVIAKDKIEKQVDCLEKLDISWGMCYTGYQLIKTSGESQISYEKRSGDCYIYALMRTLYMGSGSNLLLRKMVVNEINGYDESFRRNQDIEFLVRALEKYKIAYVDEILLTIYQEGNRKSRTFEEIEQITLHYISKFKERIEQLGKKDRDRVITVISLERFRIALYCKKFKIGINILKENKVKIRYIIKYIYYLVYRCITGKSYGFYLK